MADVANIKINGTSYSVKDSVARNAMGGPNVAATKSAMTDKSKVYVYTGSESGMTKGNWYYWNGSTWTSGGVYQSTGFSTDTTLTVSGMAADAKTTGDGISNIRTALNYPFTNIFPQCSFIKFIKVFDATYSQYALSYVWKNYSGWYYYFRLMGSNDGVNWTNVSNLSLNVYTTLKGISVYADSSFAVIVNWDEVADKESVTHNGIKVISESGGDPVYYHQYYLRSTTPFNTFIGELDWILDIQVKNTAYAEYCLMYVFLGQTSWHYLFRLGGRSNVGTGDWTYISDIMVASAPDVTPKTQILSNDDFMIFVDWTGAPEKLYRIGYDRIKTDKYASSGYRGLEKIDDIVAGALGADKSPFVNYESKFDWILDVQVNDSRYANYALTYVWRNVNSWYYYFRLMASNDNVNWVNVSNLSTQTVPEAEPDLQVLSNDSLTVTVDWTKCPSTFKDSRNKILKKETLYKLKPYVNASDLPNGSYAIKDDIKNSHIIVVDILGNGNFTDIESAFNYVRNQGPSLINQWEIIIKPGIYSSLANIVPPYTHVHGTNPNTVILTSEPYEGTSTDPTLRQDYGSSKLSNLHIISATGYCIHYDQENYGQVIRNDNLILEHKNGQQIIGGGSYAQGVLYSWNNCTFVNGLVSCHTNQHIHLNTKVEFINCKLIDARFQLISVGGYDSDHVYEISGTYTYPGAYTVNIYEDDWVTYTDASLYLANTCEWQIVGHDNDNFLPNVSQPGTGLLVEAANYNDQISISGTAIPVLFGYAKVRGGNSRIKAKAYGVYRVQDKQAGDVRGRQGIDVFQMWKRLGDCSGTPLTLTVTAGNNSKTYTFNQNYESIKTAETDILAAVNEVIGSVATIKAYSPECWENIMTDDKTYILVKESDGIKAGEYVTYDGYRCSANASNEDVLGRALEDGIPGELVQVWAGRCFATNLSVGDYGIGSDGTLSSESTTKIGYVNNNGVFVRTKH